jgi:hypothetical protein
MSPVFAIGMFVSLMVALIFGFMGPFLFDKRRHILICGLVAMCAFALMVYCGSQGVRIP